MVLGKRQKTEVNGNGKSAEKTIAISNHRQATVNNGERHSGGLTFRHRFIRLGIARSWMRL